MRFLYRDITELWGRILREQPGEGYRDKRRGVRLENPPEKTDP